jgi:hypothetical protein
LGWVLCLLHILKTLQLLDSSKLWMGALLSSLGIHDLLKAEARAMEANYPGKAEILQ